ncbi:MAG: hypothetical protein Q4C01_07460, partial [Clostridia bacterium]|nr:hypothetical protein [Clostridia bacterium]
MKKALALILSLAMVLCLIPAVATATEVTATQVTDATTLATGDKVLVVAAETNMALKNEIVASYYLAGLAVTPAEGKITVDDDLVVWDLTVNADGTLTFVNGTTTLNKSDGFNSLSTTGEIHDWAIAAYASDTITNAFTLSESCETKGLSYLRWNAGYSDFTATPAATTADITSDMAMHIYKVDAAEPGESSDPGES